MLRKSRQALKERLTERVESWQVPNAKITRPSAKIGTKSGDLELVQEGDTMIHRSVTMISANTGGGQARGGKGRSSSEF